MSKPVSSEWTGEAALGSLEAVQRFVEDRLEAAACPMKTKMKIAVAVEEVFVNIASYAYTPGTGPVRVQVAFPEDLSAVSITFTDSGMAYDPLAKEDPDIHLPVEDRELGGLGILMAKKLMDELHYEYRDGQNILTLKKNW